MTIEAQIFDHKNKTTIGRQILTPGTTIELYGETFKDGPIKMIGIVDDDETLKIEISSKDEDRNPYHIGLYVGEEINGDKFLKFTPENKLPWTEGRIVYLPQSSEGEGEDLNSGRKFKTK